jgi:hypothetical protein
MLQPERFLFVLGAWDSSIERGSAARHKYLKICVQVQVLGFLLHLSCCTKPFINFSTIRVKGQCSTLESFAMRTPVPPRIRISWNNE